MNADGKGIIEQQIRSWIEKNVAQVDVKLHGRCNKILLKHLNIERKPQGDVQSFPVRLEEGMEDEIDPLINQICDAAQKDADDLNQGVQSYAVYAYFPQDHNYVPRKVFRVSAADAEFERDLNPSEPATEKGLVAQTMRHLESVMKTNAVSLSYLVSSQQREMQRLSEQNEKFSQQQIDFMVLLQDTMDNAHRRRLDEKTTELNNAIKESAVAKLEALVPVILNRIAGEKVLPAPDGSFMLMAHFLEGLSKEQQLGFFNSLTDVQKMTFAEVLSTYEKNKAKFASEQQGQPSSQPLGTKNGLPPPPGPNGQRQIAPSTTEPDSPLVQEGDAKPIPMLMGIRDRLDHPTPVANKDPIIQKYEEDTAAFMSRFRERLQGPKKPTNGE
jgi:hypothetical protein